MPCTNCTDNQNTGFYPNTEGCVNCPSPCPDGCDAKDASCILYTGAPLNCIEAASNTNLEVILQKIDAKLCQTTGDFSGFNFYCLTNSGPINNQQQFVERISQFACTLQTNFDTFLTTTYTTDKAGLQIQITSLNTPGITSCSQLNIISSDNQNVVLNKLSNAICSLYGAINPSSANWSQCFTLVGQPPANIVEGFNVVLNQICQIKSSSGNGSLPTFDNTGSCLSSPTTTDSLVDTISKIKTRLCSTPTFNAGNLGTHTCTQFSGADTLETVLTSMLNQIDGVSTSSIRGVTSDFTLTNIDNSQLCLGKRIGLNLTNIDRRVALNSADLTPNTLDNKFVGAGTVSLDFGNINPGKVTITGTAGATADEKVKATAADPTAGYLDSKLVGSSDTISVSVTSTSSTQLRVSATVDYDALISTILDQIQDSETLKSKFCALTQSCPSPCDPPTNITITYTAS